MGRLAIDETDVLLAVDLQNDFCPHGALAVPHGDEVVPIINRLAGHFAHVVLTQDWHPPGHLSFASSHPQKKPYDTVDLAYGRQGLRPDHCVAGNAGSRLTQRSYRAIGPRTRGLKRTCSGDGLQPGPRPRPLDQQIVQPDRKLSNAHARCVEDSIYSKGQQRNIRIVGSMRENTAMTLITTRLRQPRSEYRFDHQVDANRRCDDGERDR
jgi:hypothetical protein